MRHNARLLCQYRTHHDALLFSPDGRVAWPRRYSAVAMSSVEGNAWPVVLHAHGLGPRAWRPALPCVRGR